ncbi:MAG: hypothetical protein Q9219_006331 [cf. Caloplaca sp. 3 TL-2023]
MDGDMLLDLIGPRVEDLRHLNVACSTLHDHHLAHMVSIGYMDHVVDLDLSGLAITDETVESLASRAQQLRKIRLGGTNVTGISVKSLVMKAGNKLDFLDIRDCRNVSSDAVAFARKTPGLRVRCGVSEEKYGRKIRLG